MHATLSDIVADVAANSIEAGASRVAVDFSEADGRIVLRVEDNGKGMDEATKAWRRAWQPTPVFLPGELRGAWWATVHGVMKSGT